MNTAPMPARRHERANTSDARRATGRHQPPAATRAAALDQATTATAGRSARRASLARRDRPHIPLPTPGPARKDPCAAGRTSSHRSSPGPAVTRASLQADLLAAHERTARLDTRIQQLEKRLSEALGEQPGANPGSAPRPTSTHSTNGSASSNNTASTCDNSSTNATKTSPPHGPPTANSWPRSTHQPS